MSPSVAGAPEDPVMMALQQAIRAYRGRDVAAAQAWTGIAASLLDQSATGNASGAWVLGNTAQLLPLLDLYGRVAAGADSVRDRDVADLTAWLQHADALNRGGARPGECNGMNVDYDPFTHLVRRIGDTTVDYDPFTLQIRRIDRFAIDYNPFSGQPRQIGPVSVDWDPFRPLVRAVGGVHLH